MNDRAMNQIDSGPRRYSEKEVGLILKRATELQRAEPSVPNPEGLTLGELEEIASEAGIDASLLRRAANELHTLQPTGLGSRLAGAPIEIVIERTIEGEMPRDRLEELIPVMQSATAGQGTASAVGGTLTWSSRSESNTSSQQVLVSARDGRTLIRVEERLGGLAAGLFGGIMGGVGGGVGFGLGGALGGLAGSVAVGVTLPFVVLVGSYALARAIFSGQVKRREAAAHALMDRLAEHAASAVLPERASLESGSGEAS